MRALPWLLIGLVLAGCSRGKGQSPGPAPAARAGDELVGEWTSEDGRRQLNFLPDRSMGADSPEQASPGTWSVPSAGTVRLTKKNGKTEDASYEIAGGRLVIRADGEKHTYDRVTAEERDRRQQAAAANAKQRQCLLNLKAISHEVTIYESRHKKLPATLKDLAAALPDPAAFRCPCTGKEDAYDIVPIADFDSADQRALLLHDRDPHPDGKRCAAAISGYLCILNEENFRASLKNGKIIGGE